MCTEKKIYLLTKNMHVLGHKYIYICDKSFLKCICYKYIYICDKYIYIRSKYIKNFFFPCTFCCRFFKPKSDYNKLRHRLILIIFLNSLKLPQMKINGPSSGYSI